MDSGQLEFARSCWLDRHCCCPKWAVAGQWSDAYTGTDCLFSQTESRIKFEALQDCDLLVLGGEPIDEPVVGYGPFVMNSKAEIKIATVNFQMGKFCYLTTS